MDVFAAAVDVLFADPNLGQDALWRASGLDPGTPVRIFIRRPDAIVSFGEARALMATVLIEVRTSAVSAPEVDDTFEIGSRLYHVISAGFVWSKAPGIVRVYEDGAIIRSTKGFFLAIPTQAAGKYGDGRKKITPGSWERRTGQRLRFVYRRGAPSLLVADLRARTGRRGGFSGPSLSARRTGRGLATVPIFILVPQVRIRKRLDVEGAARRWQGQLPAPGRRSGRDRRGPGAGRGAAAPQDRGDRAAGT